MPATLHRLIAFALALTCALPLAATAATDPVPVEQLLRIHDWKTTVALGNRYLKQQSLVATRDVLSRIGREQKLGPDWKRGNPAFDAAEAAIATPLLERVRADWTSLDWMPSEWSEMARSSFSDAEVGTLVEHFSSPVGRKQAKIIDHSVQFHVAGAFTMSGKLIDGYPGTEEEQKTLTYVWADEDRDMRFSIADAENAQGQQFALSPLGAKYQRTLIIKVTGILGARLDRVASSLPAQAKSLATLADPFVADFRAANGR